MQEYITELCPHCEKEITLSWDVENDGYQIYCPSCGKVIMLCGMCDRSPCDWTENGCKHSDERYRRNNDGWIPVEERLPEEDGIYIIDDRTFNSSWIHTAGFKASSKAWCENHGVYYDDKYGRYEDGRVIAWQSLPEPYKAERSEDVTI